MKITKIRLRQLIREELTETETGLSSEVGASSPELGDPSSEEALRGLLSDESLASKISNFVEDWVENNDGELPGEEDVDVFLSSLREKHEIEAEEAQERGRF